MLNSFNYTVQYYAVKYIVFISCVDYILFKMFFFYNMKTKSYCDTHPTRNLYKRKIVFSIYYTTILDHKDYCDYRTQRGKKPLNKILSSSNTISNISLLLGTVYRQILLLLIKNNGCREMNRKSHIII